MAGDDNIEKVKAHGCNRPSFNSLGSNDGSVGGDPSTEPQASATTILLASGATPSPPVPESSSTLSFSSLENTTSDEDVDLTTDSQSKVPPPSDLSPAPSPSPSTSESSAPKESENAPPPSSEKNNGGGNVSAPPPPQENNGSGNGGGASGSDIDQYLAAHNGFRGEHGAGPLSWSDDLASKAQLWANNCQFIHSEGSLGPFGENLAAGTADSFGIAQAVQGWKDEVSEYDPANPQPSHFTQVVWKASTQLGCAMALCDGIFDPSFGKAKYFVCEYAEQGNILGRFVENVE